MLAAEANNYFFQRPKRAVAIRRDGDDFVVSLMPNDLSLEMKVQAQLGLAASPLDHAGEPIGAKGRPALRREHEGRLCCCSR